MLRMKTEILEEGDEEKKLMGTINFPKNLKNLNENLPKPKYDEEGSIKFKTAKIIKTSNENKESSKRFIPIPSLKLITSEKSIAPANIKSLKDLGQNIPTVARKPKVFIKNPSQKLIF